MWDNSPTRPCPGSPAWAERCPPNGQDNSAFSGKMAGLRQGPAPGDSCMEMTAPLLGPVLCWLSVGSRRLWMGVRQRGSGWDHGSVTGKARGP